MKLKKFLLGIVLCTSTSLLWVSCKKNDVAVNDPHPIDNSRTLNGVVADDPELVAKVPMIISRDFLSGQETLLAAQLKSNPPKGGGGGPKPATSDVTAPVVNITSPAGGTSIPAGSVVNVAVSASDNTGISSVSFSVDGTLQSTIAGNTTYFIWNTAGVASGTHSIVITANDAAGNAGTASAVVTINTTIIETPPPTTTTGYQIKMPPVTTQGSEGSCVAFAVGYYARSAEQYNNTNATSYSYAANILSPEWLFDLTKSDPGSCSGSSLLNAYNFLKGTGICTWQTVPYSSGSCTISPTTSQISEAGNYKISAYSYVATADITAMKAMLNLKHPLVITIMVDSYFYSAGPNFIWKGFSTTLMGTHAIAICGYDDAKHAYRIINSWGTGWGDNGYSWIDYDFMPSLCSYGWVMNF